MVTGAAREVQELHQAARLSAAVPKAEDCTSFLGELIPKVNVSDLYTLQNSRFNTAAAGCNSLHNLTSLVPRSSE